MSSTAAKPPRPIKLNQRALLIPAAQYQAWYDQAIQVPSLTKDELAVLSAVVEYYRLLDQRGHASFPSIEQMAQSARVRSIDVTGAIAIWSSSASSLFGRVLARGGMNTCPPCRSAPLQLWRPRP
jgi:hypothetical protein